MSNLFLATFWFWFFLFVYFLYILYSKKVDRYYVGSTDNIEKRLESHLVGISRYTAIADDWVVVYSECPLQPEKKKFLSVDSRW